MDKEKMDVRELTEKELEQVSGGAAITGDIVTPSTKIKRTLSSPKEKQPREIPTPEFVICPNCGETILPRKACPNCGYPDDE